MNNYPITPQQLPAQAGIGAGYYVTETAEAQTALREKMLDVRIRNRALMAEAIRNKVSGFWTVWSPKMRREQVYLKHLPIFLVRTTIEDWLKAYRAKNQREDYLGYFQPTLLMMYQHAEPQAPEPVEDPQGNIQLQMQYATQLAEWERQMERISNGDVRLYDVVTGWWSRMYRRDPEDMARMLRDFRDGTRSKAA